MANKICPSCGRVFKGLARFCSQCGIELKKEPNKCSSPSTQLCRDAVFDEEDIFCRYCGALTTFAKERQM